MVVSPAKNLDFDSTVPVTSHTQPALMDQTKVLVSECKKLAPHELSSMMKISDKLAILNAERFSSFSWPFTTQNAKQALFAFNGDVYTGLDAANLTADDVAFSQRHLRILSGLYGVLRPLDLMQPYRLEMGTKLSTKQGKNLYEYWKTSITEQLNDALQESNHTKHDDNVLINLASTEYFSSVKKSLLNAKVITPHFRDEKNGNYKIISFFAKKARGLMARYIIQNRINSADELKHFNLAGYEFDQASSADTDLVFKRSEAAMLAHKV